MVRNIFNGINRGAKIVQKTIFVVAVFVTIFQLFFYFMNKDKINFQTDTYEQSRKKLYDFVTDPKMKESDEGKIQITLYRMFLCNVIGETCSLNMHDKANDFSKSFSGKLSKLLVAPYENPPASGLLWAYGGLENAGFVPKSYAQGVGFAALQPLIPIWSVFRNISYMLIVLIVVSIGFMIMFRANLGAQTVISIENALPRIIIALLLITFSFAIAGFLIDIMYIVMALGGSIIVNNLASGDPAKTADLASKLGWHDDIFTQQGFGLFDGIFWNGNIWKTGSAILSLVPWGLQIILRVIIGNAVAIFLTYLQPVTSKFLQGSILDGTPFGGIAKPVIAGVAMVLIWGLIAGLMPVIISLIVYVTLLILFFRIFFLLIVTYTKILLSIIFAPIVLLFEAFPSTSTFGYWFKGLFFNLLTFPIVAILIMVSGLIANVASIGAWANIPDTSNGQLWAPPFIYSIHTEGFVMLIAVSMILLIPDMIVFIKKSFGVEDLPFNVTPGKFLSGAGAFSGGFNLFMRSRSLSREMGWYRDTNAKGFGRVLNAFKPKNEMKEWAEAQAKLSEAANADRKNTEKTT